MTSMVCQLFFGLHFCCFIQTFTSCSEDWQLQTMLTQPLNLIQWSSKSSEGQGANTYIYRRRVSSLRVPVARSHDNTVNTGYPRLPLIAKVLWLPGEQTSNILGPAKHPPCGADRDGLTQSCNCLFLSALLLLSPMLPLGSPFFFFVAKKHVVAFSGHTFYTPFPVKLNKANQPVITGQKCGRPD